MDAAQALADLTEISSQIEAAVLFDETGAPLGATVADEGATRELARAAQELLAAAEGAASDERPIAQLEAATHEGSVFVVRGESASIAATTRREPTTGLVFYDLKSCLRSLEPREDAQEPVADSTDDDAS